MKRLAALAVLAGVLLPTPAAAQPADDFRLCAAVSEISPRCHNAGVTYEAGQTVFLRGRISPPHPGYGQVLRRDPGARTWRVVGLMGVAEDGRVRWSWPAKRRDVNGGRPYLFAFRIRGVGRSNLVEVWIVPRHV